MIGQICIACQKPMGIPLMLSMNFNKMVNSRRKEFDFYSNEININDMFMC